MGKVCGVIGRVVGVAVLMALALAFVARPAGAASGDVVEVDMKAVDDSGIAGTALITDLGGAVSVEIELAGPGVTGGHPAHVHLGSCADAELNPTYPLADIDAEGLSSTTIAGISLDDLLAEPYSIIIHASLSEITDVVACGDIVDAAAGVPEPAAPAAPEVAAPATSGGAIGAAGSAASAVNAAKPQTGVGGPTTTGTGEAAPAAAAATVPDAALPASGVGTAIGGQSSALVLPLMLVALAGFCGLGGAFLFRRGVSR